MPRKPRVEFEGAVYHVMCRGDHREPIVQDDVDRAEFRHCLGGAAVAERDRRTAEELLPAALDAVGLSACDLSRLRKNAHLFRRDRLSIHLFRSGTCTPCSPGRRN